MCGKCVFSVEYMELCAACYDAEAGTCSECMRQFLLVNVLHVGPSIICADCMHECPSEDESEQ